MTAQLPADMEVPRDPVLCIGSAVLTDAALTPSAIDGAQLSVVGLSSALLLHP